MLTDLPELSEDPKLRLAAEGEPNDLPKLWDDRWFISLPWTGPLELLKVLPPPELTLRLKIEEAAFLVVLV